MKFIDELIDKNNSKCPKAFTGIIGMITLAITTAIYHTDALAYSLALASAGALGFSLGESVIDKIKSKPPVE